MPRPGHARPGVWFLPLRSPFFLRLCRDGGGTQAGQVRLPRRGHRRHGPAFFANAEKPPPDCRCRAVRARARKPLSGHRYSRCPQNIHKKNQRFIPRKFSCCGAICLRDSGSVATLSIPQRIARHRAGRKGLRVTWAGRSDLGPGRNARVNGAPVDHEGSSDAERSPVSQGPERAATGFRTRAAVAVP